MRRPIEGRGTKSSQNDGPSSVAVSVLDEEWKRPPPPSHHNRKGWITTVVVVFWAGGVIKDLRPSVL